MRFVKTTGLEEAQRRLEELASRGQDLTPVLKEIGDDEVTRTLLRFEHGKAPDGTPWKGLQSREGQTLVDTGTLRSSITKQLLGSSTLLIYTDVNYAGFHQFGTRHIPARPFLGVSDDLIQSTKELINAYFLDL